MKFKSLVDRSILAVACTLIALWITGCGSGYQPSYIRSESVFSFEDGVMDWKNRETADSLAITSVSRSDDMAYDGIYSLKAQVDLRGGSSTLAKAEVYVEVTPQNLEGRTITLYVYSPPEAVGDLSHPNGYQILVQDKLWLGQYGAYNNITPGVWQEITLTPSATTPPGGWMQDGFDPTAIRAVGLKISAGGGSTAVFQGAIYIDAVSWTP